MIFSDLKEVRLLLKLKEFLRRNKMDKAPKARANQKPKEKTRKGLKRRKKNKRK
jgi:hypothetical protein